jgi:hypothetical protein
MIYLLLKRDTSLVAIQEAVTRKPLVVTDLVSIAPGGTGTVSLNVPDNEMWFVKSWAITKGADVTVNSIKIDGNNTGLIGSLADTVPEYGGLITGDQSFTIDGSNAGAAVQNLEVVIKGYKIKV